MNTLRTLALPASIISMTLFGLIAGFFYAFSVDVMRGLDIISPDGAIEAMQGINIAVRNPVFFITFFVTPIAGLITSVIHFQTGDRRASLFMIAATLIYFFGAFLPTAIVNVPMNEALAVLEPSNDAIATKEIWEAYSGKWTFWNTARTLASSLSLILSGLSIAAIKK